MKIREWKWEDANRTGTDNTMDKRKSTNGQYVIYNTLHRKQQTEQHEPHWIPEVESAAQEE
jgi:hypothetical protein